MKELLRSAKIYRDMGGDVAHTVLVTFSDEVYLRALLKECAKAFFHAKDGSREAELIDKETLTDCLIFPPQGGKLTAEMCAKIIDESVLLPVEQPKKLIVLDNFHTASAVVQNKLLKVLEEPPEKVYFLLGTVNEYAALPTVRSRAQRELVPPFPEEQIASALARMYPRENGRAAAAACGGILSDAEALLSGGEEVFVRAETYLGGERTEEFCRSLTDKKDAKLFFSSVRMVLRDVMFVRQGLSAYAARRSEGTKRLAEMYSVGAARRGISLVGQAEQEITFNANFSQCALNLALQLKKERETWQRLS